MHPVSILLPVFAAAFGPRLWAGRLLRRHDDEDPALPPAGELARRLLDQHGLMLVRVEATDVGAHYDPVAKAVRLPRQRLARRSLTAATMAVHEVGHAMQDAEGYPPFRLHLALARVARVSGDLGTVLLLAVPLAAVAGKGPLPSLVVTGSAAAMLGTSLAAQAAALPSELDASFARAMPMLTGCCAADQRLGQARWILAACALTHLSSSVNPLLLLWSWFGVRAPLTAPAAWPLQAAAVRGVHWPAGAHAPRPTAMAAPAPGRPRWALAVQRLARPLVRAWLRRAPRA